MPGAKWRLLIQLLAKNPGFKEYRYMTSWNRHKPVHKRRWTGLNFVAITLLIISLGNTIMNVGLPSIATDLPASANGLQWVADFHTLVFAAALLTAGSIGNRLGRRKQPL
jgi:hypothetical protein